VILGAHESAAGGCHRVFERCARDGASAVQVWTRSSRQWAAPTLDDAQIAAFKKARRALGGKRFPTAAHASYLINLAAPPGEVRDRSVGALIDELQRADALGIDQVIVHPGAAMGQERDVALRRVGDALVEICRTVGARPKVRLLLELTAGQGSCVGCSFEELAAMLEAAADRRLGVCLDTQHMFAAGIDWTTARGYAATMESFDRVIGLRHLEAFHLNDSKRPLGSRVDRHAPIGHGVIGVAPFKRLLVDERLAEIPGYLETPPLPDGEESYADGLQRLRALLPRGARTASGGRS